MYVPQGIFERLVVGRFKKLALRQKVCRQGGVRMHVFVVRESHPSLRISLLQLRNGFLFFSPRVLSPWKFPQVEIKEHVQQALQVVLPALVFLFMSPQRCIHAGASKFRSFSFLPKFSRLRLELLREPEVDDHELLPVLLAAHEVSWFHVPVQVSTAVHALQALQHLQGQITANSQR